jgi:serine/threonine protein kinase
VLKQVSKSRLTRIGFPLAQNEGPIHLKLSNHPNIVKLINYFETESSFQLLMEWCSEGSYFEDTVVEVSNFGGLIVILKKSTPAKDNLKIWAR